MDIPFYNSSKFMDFMKMRKYLKYFISSCLLAGQFLDCWTFLLSSSLLVWSNVHWWIRWSTVWSSLLQGHVALSINLNQWSYALVLPCPVTMAMKFGFMLIFIFNLSLTFGKNSLVMAAFVQLSRSVRHFCVTTLFNLLYNVLVGILLKETAMSLFRVADLDSWSANSFP